MTARVLHSNGSARILRTALALALWTALPSGHASAGLLDAPPPSFTGGTGRIVYRMGPVHHDPGWVETFVACTNTGNAPTDVALEIFDDEDRPAGGIARATVAAGARATFAVSAGSEATTAAGAVLVPGAPVVEHGKARISSPTSALGCTAWLRVGGTDGTVKEAPLELVKKVAAPGS